MMFKELRIGNWVAIEPGWFKQWDNKDYEAYGKFVDGEYSNDKVEPIGLIPEILEKAGFVERDRALLESYGYRNFIHRNATIQIGPNGIKTWVSNKMDEPVEHIKYLHELQNLYFALTGEELEVNL